MMILAWPSPVIDEGFLRFAKTPLPEGGAQTCRVPKVGPLPPCAPVWLRRAGMHP
jgi:hypothetical protein